MCDMLLSCVCIYTHRAPPNVSLPYTLFPFPALFLSAVCRANRVRQGGLLPDIMPPRPDAGGMAGGTEPGAWFRLKPSFALPVDDRAGHPLRHPCIQGRTDDPRRQ